MDLAAKTPAGEGVSEFVECLDQDQSGIEPEQVARGKDALRLLAQGREIVDNDLQGDPHDQQPDDQPDPTEHHPADRSSPFQEVVRIEQRYAREHDAPEKGFAFALFALGEAFE